MSFKDIFKKSFLEGFASAEITTVTIVIALGIACVLALYIFFVYRVVTRKTFYSKNFNITLDTGLSSSRDVSRFLDPELPRRPVMPTGMQLLEVKYDAYLPDFIYQSLQLSSLRQTAFSKYYLCRKFTR